MRCGVPNCSEHGGKVISPESPDTWDRTIAGYAGSCEVFLTCPICGASVHDHFPWPNAGRHLRWHGVAMPDGYNTTIVLDCGCRQRLNLENTDGWKVGYWTSCSRHSKVIGYLRSTGEPDFDRDRQTVEVIHDGRGHAGNALTCDNTPTVDTRP